MAKKSPPHVKLWNLRSYIKQKNQNGLIPDFLKENALRLNRKYLYKQNFAVSLQHPPTFFSSVSSAGTTLGLHFCIVSGRDGAHLPETALTVLGY